MQERGETVTCVVAELDGSLIGMAWLVVFERVPNIRDTVTRAAVSGSLLSDADSLAAGIEAANWVRSVRGGEWLFPDMPSWHLLSSDHAPRLAVFFSDEAASTAIAAGQEIARRLNQEESLLRHGPDPGWSDCSPRDQRWAEWDEPIADWLMWDGGPARVSLNVEPARQMEHVRVRPNLNFQIERLDTPPEGLPVDSGLNFSDNVVVLTESQTQGLLDLMVGTTHRKRDNLGHIYLGCAGVDLPRYLSEYFERESRAQVREDLLRFAGPAARSDDRVVQLAALALTDRSARVRRTALWLFALSANPAALPLLTAWRPRNADDSAYRARAIRAIERQDIQEWVRDTPYDEVIPWQFSRHEVGSAEFDDQVDRYVVRVAADLVPDLERVLGDIHLAPR